MLRGSRSYRGRALSFANVSAFAGSDRRAVAGSDSRAVAGSDDRAVVGPDGGAVFLLSSVLLRCDALKESGRTKRKMNILASW